MYLLVEMQFTSPDTVIEVIAAGNRAAVTIDKYLNDGEESEDVVIGPSLVEDEEAMTRGRYIILTLEKEKRIKGFDKVELGFTREMAVNEAKRCLKCHEKE